MSANMRELGTTGLRRTGGFVIDEFLPQLQGIKGVRVYREMADNDPTVGAILFAIEKVLQRLEWRVDPADDDNDIAVEQAEFIEECLHDMSDSWDATLSAMLSMLTYGWSYHEIVYKKRSGWKRDPRKRSQHDDGKIGWRKWAIRSQETLWEWEFDEDGGIQGFWQVDPSTYAHRVFIPIEKALLFRTTTVKNNPEGRSLLRNAYRSWWYKRRIEEIEAVGIERDLAGLPVAHVPPEYLSSAATPEQVAVLNAIREIVTGIKRNEQEGVIYPAMYDEKGNRLFQLELMSSGGARQFDIDKTVSRYDQRIAMTLLSDFILLGDLTGHTHPRHLRHRDTRHHLGSVRVGGRKATEVTHVLVKQPVGLDDAGPNEVDHELRNLGDVGLCDLAVMQLGGELVVHAV